MLHVSKRSVDEKIAWKKSLPFILLHLSVFAIFFIDVAMSDVFLSPSIQDAGPMMLNQALMCGTPAVAFNIGVAYDIINDKTGYLAKYRDSEDFCKGIIK